MAIAEQITCDVCGTAKGETNHWLAAVVVPPQPDEPNERLIAFAPLDTVKPEDVDAEDRDAAIEHICGQACAHTRLSQWLDELSNSPTTERQPE